jgi:zinc protease
MTARLRALAMVLGFVAVTQPVVDRAAQEWPRESPPPPLARRPVVVPPYVIRTLANGLQVVVVLQHEQPAVSFRLLVRAGTVQEPADRPGVASMVATLLNQGTATKSAQEIATLIDSAGGILGVGAGSELTYVNGAVVKDETDAALGLVADIVQHPAFAPDEIELQRRQVLSSLQVAYDDPEYIANVVFDRLVFGRHPYGDPDEGTPASIARITRADLVEFHRRWFVPNNALLAIVGDLTTEEAFAAATRAFGGWARGPVPTVTTPPLPPPAPRLVVIDRPGSAQTEIRAGILALPRSHPDYLALDLATRILGGEGANRLFGVLRTEHALTYGASASLHAFQNGGEIVAETNTRTAATVEALRLIVDEFARLPRDPVNPGELSGAENFIAGNYPLSIESSGAIAEEVLSHLFFGQDLSEIDTYLDRVMRVTPAAVERVARQIVRPDALAIVLVGDASAFIRQLPAAGFPAFQVIKLSDLDLDSPTLARDGVPPAAGRSSR